MEGTSLPRSVLQTSAGNFRRRDYVTRGKEGRQLLLILVFAYLTLRRRSVIAFLKMYCERIPAAGKNDPDVCGLLS